MIERFTVTERGKRLLAKAQAGTALNYTKIEVGSGRAPEGQDSTGLTALVNPVKSIGISGVSVSRDRALVTAQFTNGGVESAFAWNEVGLFAQDPSEGEILYARGEADEGKWVMIPAETEAAVSFTFSMQTVIGDAQDVTAVIDPSAVFLTQADLNKYVLNEGGDIAQTVVTFAVPESATVTDLTSGSATGTLMGRVKRLLTSAFDQIGTKAANGHGHEQADVKDLKTALDAKVPTARTVNGHALTGDVTLTAGDVGAAMKPMVKTVTLAAAGWTAEEGAAAGTYIQTTKVADLDPATDDVAVTPAPTSLLVYGSAGVRAVEPFRAGEVDFYADSIPGVDLTVYVQVVR